ncbi:MAG: hypothetical protein PHS53_00555 [Candidatus Pacebacteria bacterium]|nr:hypothetical protein [Candidatus Paceibacterota bacterium]MDD5356627.1 hypothetical protein [Candidatus Paceibacterota bacterium]
MAFEQQLVEATLAGLKGGMLHWQTLGYSEVRGIIKNLSLSAGVIQVDLLEDPLTVIHVKDRLERPLCGGELSLCRIVTSEPTCTGEEKNGVFKFEWQDEDRRFVVTLTPPEKPKDEKKGEKKEGVATAASKPASESPSQPFRSPQRPKSRA